jgi:nuclear pore complex protein Nup85
LTTPPPSTTLRGLSKASVFFLETLKKHPSSDLRTTAEVLAPILSSQPRLQNHASEREFVTAHKKWVESVKALRLRLDRVPEAKRIDKYENWWSRMSDIVGMLEGRGEVIKRVCFELGADWKEVCAAWGIFVNPRLRRKELP